MIPMFLQVNCDGLWSALYYPDVQVKRAGLLAGDILELSVLMNSICATSFTVHYLKRWKSSSVAI